MKVAVYHNNKDVRIEERPMPKIGPGELLIKVMASGICGSDVMEWYRLKKAPCVLGHETSGEVVEAGRGVARFKKGDRVVFTHHVPCNDCRYCKRGFQTLCDTLRATNFDPGGFSQFVRLPAINVERGTLALPDSVSFEEATFVEPLGCVVRGFRLARFEPGLSVLVLGSGMAGILTIALAKSLGAGRIVATDISPFRLELAKKFGADAVLPASDVTQKLVGVNNGSPAEFVVVCAGAPAVFSQALKCADRGAAILYFAPAEPGQEIPLPIFDFWHNGTTLTSSYGASIEDLTQALDLIREKRVPVAQMISHRLDLEEAPLGFKLVAEAKESLKVILEPHRASN
ncbi:MAG: alcohol dehydrogenase catalytic domain-containing protein [Elusimicrobia bacterium]|nr:alcohol dehydrogenase catalytic domain-containing protein [Elusimicrobiota bacterium]